MEEEQQQLTKKQLLAFFAMIVGMFMAVLDIQIVASSLSVIAAGLSASTDELSWIQTSYLIAEVIIIPISGFIARAFSTRLSYFVAAFGFTIMSVLCSLAWNIESMIIFRALQGFFGGAMIPTVFSTIYIIFPPKQRPTVTIIIGLVVTIAPTLGPTLGGYITEIISWHFMFLLNLLPGIFVCTTVYLCADFDKPNHNLLKNFDYLGIILMVVSLGSLQYLLEEGNKLGWFEDSLILFLSMISFISFVLLLIRENTFINPILDFGAFNNRNFTFGCVYSFVLGIGLYGSIYMLPLFLVTVAGFDTIQIGITMMVAGAAQFLSAPIAGKLSATGIDLRLMLAIGLIMFGIGCYANSFLTPDSQFWDFLVPQIIRGMSLMFCFIPINNVTLGTMSKNEVQNASGLYNLTRNLGGAIGLASISSYLTNQTKISYQYLSENISLSSAYTASQIDSVRGMLSTKLIDPDQIELAARMQINGLLSKNAFTIAINQMFMVIAVIFIVSVIFLPFTTNIKAVSDAPTH